MSYGNEFVSATVQCTHQRDDIGLLECLTVTYFTNDVRIEYVQTSVSMSACWTALLNAATAATHRGKGALSDNGVRLSVATCIWHRATLLIMMRQSSAIIVSTLLSLGNTRRIKFQTKHRYSFLFSATARASQIISRFCWNPPDNDTT